jgi:cytochrome c-type biogenesis protein
MMQHLFEQAYTVLSNAMSGAPAIALVAALVWGMLSVVLSPCHLSSIPLIIGFINGQGKLTTRRTFGLSTLFAVGILVTIALIGVVTAMAKRMWGDLGPYANYFVAAVFVLVGLHLLGIIPMPWSGPGNVKMKRKGLVASFILGLVFGIALGPCTFAFMAPVLGLVLSMPSSKLYYGVLLLLAYGIGHCLVIAGAGTSARLVQRYLNWNEGTKAASVIRKVCGILVIIAGIRLIW